jgi:hypothetical protein
MSAATCGVVFPGYRSAHPGYTAQHGGLLRGRLQRPRRNRSPHERSDMRGGLSRMSLRSSGLHRSTRRASSLRLRRPGATVARMSAAICGLVFPGCRFAHPGYTAQHEGGFFAGARNAPGASNRSPHERSDMKGGLSRMSLRSSGLHRSTRRALRLRSQRPIVTRPRRAAASCDRASRERPPQPGLLQDACSSSVSLRWPKPVTSAGH